MANDIKGIAPQGKALFTRNRRPSHKEACDIATELCQPRPVTHAQKMFGLLMSKALRILVTDMGYKASTIQQ
jgi:hypothetical protein